MTGADISRLVATLRDALEEHRRPYELWTPEIPAGCELQAVGDGVPPGVAGLLTISDGLYLTHSTRLFSSGDLPDEQVSENLVGARLPDGSRLTDAAPFFCFGQAVGNPLLVDGRDGSVWRVPDDGVVWYTGCRLERIAGTVDEFVTDWVVGDRFPDLAGLSPDVAADSDWYRLLKLSGLAS
ncbi:hypothetical protein [Kitasatospora terrestris]